MYILENLIMMQQFVVNETKTNIYKPQITYINSW